MNSKQHVRRRTIIRVPICKWALVLALIGYGVLFGAELFEFLQHPSPVSITKAIGYALLLGILAFKILNIPRNKSGVATDDAGIH